MFYGQHIDHDDHDGRSVAQQGKRASLRLVATRSDIGGRCASPSDRGCARQLFSQRGGRPCTRRRLVWVRRFGNNNHHVAVNAFISMPAELGSIDSNVRTGGWCDLGVGNRIPRMYMVRHICCGLGGDHVIAARAGRWQRHVSHRLQSRSHAARRRCSCQ